MNGGQDRSGVDMAQATTLQPLGQPVAMRLRRRLPLLLLLDGNQGGPYHHLGSGNVDGLPTHTIPVRNGAVGKLPRSYPVHTVVTVCAKL